MERYSRDKRSKNAFEGGSVLELDVDRFEGITDIILRLFPHECSVLLLRPRLDDKEKLPAKRGTKRCYPSLLFSSSEETEESGSNSYALTNPTALDLLDQPY